MLTLLQASDNKMKMVMLLSSGIWSLYSLTCHYYHNTMEVNSTKALKTQ